MTRDKRNEQVNRNRRSGFTLVELLMVVCILGILYAGARLIFTGQDQEARITTTRGSIATIEQAVQIFGMKHNGKLPDALEELTAGTDDAPGLLREGALNDSWGTPFSYSRQGKRFKITSAGPDCEMGSEDDITN
jgi:general secretion pathway protein G